MLNQALLPHMLARGKGRIVVVSSMAGKVPSPGQAVYSAAKTALQGLLQEPAGRGVQQVGSAAMVSCYRHAFLKAAFTAGWCCCKWLPLQVGFAESK